MCSHINFACSRFQIDLIAFLLISKNEAVLHLGLVRPHVSLERIVHFTSLDILELSYRFHTWHLFDSCNI